MDSPSARVVAVAQHVAHERADHLRVAVVAALADVEVAARELERRVGLLARVLDAGTAVLTKTVGRICDDAADEHGDEGQHGEGAAGVLRAASCQLGALRSRWPRDDVDDARRSDHDAPSERHQST